MSPIQVISLTRRDSIHSAREALRLAEPGGQVWMVLPFRAGWARSLVNLKLLKRTAEGSDIELHLVTLHAETRLLARDAGLVAHMVLPPGLSRYRVSRPTEGHLAERVVGTGIALGPGWRRRPPTLGVGTVLVSLGLIAGLIAGLLGTAATFAPTATIIVEPLSQEVEGTLDVTADPRYVAVQYDTAIVPARSVQAIVSGRGQVAATGRVDVADAHASGQVVFANRTDEPVVVPKGTVVRTSAGVPVRFLSVGDVEVPARLYGHARVGVVAEEPGPIGNVRALTINVVEGAVASMVDVLNDTATTGGTVGAVAVVSAADLDTVRAETLQRLGEQAYREIIPQLEGREFVPADSLEVLVMSQHYDQVIDQRSEVVSMEMKVVARGLALDSAALEDLAARHLVRLAGGSDDLAVIPDSLEVSRSPGRRTEENTYLLTISARGKVAPTVDTEAVERAVSGKTVGEARRWLREELPLEGEPIIQVWPSWWPFVPWLRGRLSVQVTTGVS